jgi:hypothetical protein
VERDARLVGERDPGDRDLNALARQQREQGSVERAADTPPTPALADVDRHVGGPSIRRTIAVRCRVGIADHPALLRGNEPGVARRELLDPLGELARIGRALLEGDGRVADERCVDRRTVCGVALRIGMADRHAADCL